MNYYWRGEKIRIRAMEEDDADIFMAGLQNADIQRNECEIKIPMSQKACENFAAEQAAMGNDNRSPFLVIEDTRGNKVGMATPSLEDERAGVFTCGMYILPEFQRHGYAKEALSLIMGFYFEELRCCKFNASVYSYNGASNAMCERLGLVYEGRRRCTVYTGGKHYDEILYGLTAEEFFTLKNNGQI